MSARTWQRIEGGLIFVCALALALMTNYDSFNLGWPVLLFVFFVPDISFVAYLAGPKVGAFIYNLFHLYVFGPIFAISSMMLFFTPFEFGPDYIPYEVLGWIIGCIWTAHVGFDRMLGYGLKEPTGFQDTHLGRIGRK